MTAKEIYTTIGREVVKDIYSYDEQMIAISKWIESEFTHNSTKVATKQLETPASDICHSVECCPSCGQEYQPTAPQICISCNNIIPNLIG